MKKSGKSPAVTRESDPPLKPLAERPASAILAAVVGCFWLLRLCSSPRFLICDRGRSGNPRIYVDRPLPLREAGETLAELLRGYPVGHEWRWRLCLCPEGEVSREGVHVLLMREPTPVQTQKSGRGEARKNPSGAAGERAKTQKNRAQTVRQEASKVPAKNDRSAAA